MRAAFRVGHPSRLHESHALFLHFEFSPAPVQLRRQMTLIDGRLMTHDDLAKMCYGKHSRGAEMEMARFKATLTQRGLADQLGCELAFLCFTFPRSGLDYLRLTFLQ
jgi:hypothetical protein